MEAPCLCFSSILPSRARSVIFRSSKEGFNRRKGCAARTFAWRKDVNGRPDRDGKIVDENMIVLRMRIRELKMLESDDHEPPNHWMDWEKRYLGNYESNMFEVVGLLQTMLMNTRPSLAFGTMALIALFLPCSVLMLMFRFTNLLGN